MKINHPLMHNNFAKSDMDAVRKLIKKKDLILTQSKNVLEFEKNGPNGLALDIVFLSTPGHQQT
tara:strand:- start:173 stop:364 length:192 start_codon:yes stop_codon:yes gene_type:complete